MNSRNNDHAVSERLQRHPNNKQPRSLLEKLKTVREIAGIPLHPPNSGHKVPNRPESETGDKNDRSHTAAMTSVRNTPNKTDTPSSQVAEHQMSPYTKQKGAVDIIPGTPSTILNVSPWKESSRQLSAASFKDHEDQSEIVTPEPVTLPHRSSSTGKRPKVRRDDSNDSDIELAKVENKPSWRDNKSLAECNWYMLTNQIDYDVTFLIGRSQEAIVAHSFVMSARSANMYELIAQQKGKISKLIVIPEVAPSVFNEILKYFYTDDITLNISLALSIIPATSIVGSRDLMFYCFKYLLTEMSAENVCTILELAHNSNVKQVYSRCLQFIFSNAEEVLVTNGFRELCTECVEDIVKSDHLNAEELSVYDALIAWADKQFAHRGTVPTDELRRKVLGELLYHVRFVVMDVDHFAQKVSKAEVLPRDDKLALYQAKYEKNTSLSENLNKKPRQRKNRITSDADIIEPPIKSSTPFNDKGESVQDYEHLSMEKVTRFGDLGGSWTMKGPDAICLTVSSPIILRGVQVFGPIEVTEKFKVDIVVFDDNKRELRTNTVQINPKNRVKVYDVLLDDPLALEADETYTILLSIKSKPTHHGINGQQIIVKGEMKFEFKDSNKSYNGTGVSIGQIPSILYNLK